MRKSAIALGLAAALGLLSAGSAEAQFWNQRPKYQAPPKNAPKPAAQKQPTTGLLKGGQQPLLGQNPAINPGTINPGAGTGFRWIPPKNGS